MLCFQGKNEIFCNHPPICLNLHNNFVVNQTNDFLQVNVRKEFIVTEVEAFNFKLAKLISLPQPDRCFINLLLTVVIINIFIT